MKARIAIFMFLVSLAVIAFGQETFELVKPKHSVATQSDTTLFLMNSITASDSAFVPAPVVPTYYFDVTYYSVAADDSIIFCLYSADSTDVSYWRPIPKLTSLPVTRYFANVPISGIGVVRADTANTFYEILFYHNPK